MHAAIQFQHDHPEVSREWYGTSNYLGFLEVDSQQELERLAEQASRRGIKYSIFREPDIDNETTAIALEPGIESKKLCSNLRLALKE
jgi:hypothetical protein